MKLNPIENPSKHNDDGWRIKIKGVGETLGHEWEGKRELEREFMFGYVRKWRSDLDI